MLTVHHYPASFNFTKLLGCAKPSASKHKNPKQKKKPQQQDDSTMAVDGSDDAAPARDPRVPTTLGFGRGRARFMSVHT